MTDETANPQGAAPTPPTEVGAGQAVAADAAPAAGTAAVIETPQPLTPMEELRSRLMKWFDAVAQEWRSARGKKAMAQVGVPIEPEKAASAIQEPIVSKGRVKRGSDSVPLAITVSDAAALAITRMSPGSETVEALDDISMAIFGESILKVFASLETAWRAASGPDVEVEAGSPERTDKPAEPAPGTLAVPIVMSFEDNTSVPFSFVFGAGLSELLARPSTVAADGTALAVVISPAKMSRILKIRVPLRVEIARRRISVREVVAFKPGTVLDFEKDSEDLLELRAGRERIGRGEAVKVGESFGMRVLEIGTIRDRIKSLAQ